MKVRQSAAVAGAITAIGMPAPAIADAKATGCAAHSAGFLAGNVVRIPAVFWSALERPHGAGVGLSPFYEQEDKRLCDRP
ncbi:chaplin family protein [Streptomyces acidicola]|uniref:chaplin family protein n=1 Tax=Streptomyces acidicola TaxID=2596892 RepID=UPI00379E3EAF